MKNNYRYFQRNTVRRVALFYIFAISLISSLIEDSWILTSTFTFQCIAILYAM